MKCNQGILIANMKFHQIVKHFFTVKHEHFGTAYVFCLYLYTEVVTTPLKVKFYYDIWFCRDLVLNKKVKSCIVS